MKNIDKETRFKRKEKEGGIRGRAEREECEGNKDGSLTVLETHDTPITSSWSDIRPKNIDISGNMAKNMAV
jgi:hypothetical protein